MKTIPAMTPQIAKILTEFATAADFSTRGMPDGEIKNELEAAAATVRMLADPDTALRHIKFLTVIVEALPKQAETERVQANAKLVRDWLEKGA